MASISDSAGIFTGAVLEAFNQMEFLVARDGDTAYAQKMMLEAMQKVCVTQQVGTAATGQGSKQRGK